MRRSVSVFLAVVTGGLLLAAAGFAATIQTGSYRGTGHDYWNNGPHWVSVKGTEPIHFTVSQDRLHVTGFRGKYAYYCGAGSAYVVAASLRIHSGHFTGNGHQANKYGVNYFSLSGHFTGAGHTATVTYQDDFVYAHKKLANPYSFAFHPSQVACQSRVVGTLKAG